MTHELTGDAVYLSTIDTTTLNKSSSLCIPITLDNTKVMFKVDTGAEVTVTSQEMYKLLGRFTKPLEKPSKKLYVPACQPLNSLGQFSAKLTHGQNTSTGSFFVVKGLKSNLLEFPAISSLKLI